MGLGGVAVDVADDDAERGLPKGGCWETEVRAAHGPCRPATNWSTARDASRSSSESPGSGAAMVVVPAVGRLRVAVDVR